MFNDLFHIVHVEFLTIPIETYTNPLKFDRNLIGVGFVGKP